MLVLENEFRLQNEENKHNWISDKRERAPLQPCQRPRKERIILCNYAASW